MTEDQSPESPSGSLQSIWIKRVRLGPMDPQESAELIVDSGLADNANIGGKRQVTILEAERWADVQNDLGVEVDPTVRRANLMIKNLRLEESRGKALAIGECRILIHGETRGCRRLEEQQPGLLETVRKGGWRAGAYGEVIGGGTIRLGDPVRWIDGADGIDGVEESENSAASNS